MDLPVPEQIAYQTGRFAAAFAGRTAVEIRRLALCGALFPADAAGQMIVDEPCGLQMGVADRGPEEFESPFFHVPAHGVGLGRRHRNFAQRPERVDDRLPVGKERQRVVVETPELLLQKEEQPCVRDRSLDFQPVSHDAVRVHQPFDIFVGHSGHPFGVEIAECLAIPFALAEDRYPAQSGLGALQHQKFEQRPVVGDGFAPLFVVVFHIQFVGSAPTAAAVCQILHNRNDFNAA